MKGLSYIIGLCLAVSVFTTFTYNMQCIPLNLLPVTSKMFCTDASASTKTVFLVSRRRPVCFACNVVCGMKD